MQTTNGSSNGAQARPGRTGQPATHINGAVGNNHSAAMRVAHHNAYAHQGRQAQPVFPGQHQMANIDGNPYTMTIRGSSGAPMPVAQVHAQNAQQPPQGQQYLSGPQTFNDNGFGPALPMFNNPAAMNALCQLASALSSQPGQPQQLQQYGTQQYGNLQQYEPLQQYQTLQPHGNLQQHGNPQQQAIPQQHETPQQYQSLGTDSASYPNQFGDNISVVGSARSSATQNSQSATYSTPSTPRHHISPGVQHRPGSDSTPDSGSPLSNGNPAGVGAGQPSQPSTNNETPEQFQARVDSLVEEKGSVFLGLIGNDADYDRYKQAVWKAKLSGGSYENRAQDFPQDQAGQMRVKKQIVEAFFNLSGEQDPASETGGFDNCLAVKIVRGLSPIQAELLAHELMIYMKKVQLGEPVTTPDVKVVQESTFAAKVKEVVAALSLNKLLCRSAMTADNLLARIAADPVGERRKKATNIRNNLNKAKVLAAESLKKGTSRKGKGKRAAAQAEAESENEAGAEVSEAVVAPQAAA